MRAKRSIAPRIRSAWSMGMMMLPFLGKSVSGLPALAFWLCQLRREWHEWSILSGKSLWMMRD